MLDNGSGGVLGTGDHVERGSRLLDCFRELEKDQRLNLICLAGVFFLSLVFCWLLSLAYPEGLVTEETLTYWLLQKDFHWCPPYTAVWYFLPDSIGQMTFGFHWFGENQLDWYRTVPYAALLSLFSHFKNPTNALYWLNSLAFSLDCVLVFVLGRLLFGSLKAALALAICALLIEVAGMRIFFINLQLIADPLYAELVYMGTLLALIAWMKRWYPLFFGSCLIFGLAAFAKPIGTSLWFIWLPFAILWFGTQPLRLSKKLLLIAATFILLVGPLGLWCLRNYCIYGFAKSSGVGGSSFLQAVLPFISDDEHLFDDPHINAEFNIAVQECNKFSHHFLTPEERKNASMIRTFSYEIYYLYSPVFMNPFQVIGAHVNPGWIATGFHFVTEFPPKEMFRIDEEAGRLAWQIIKNHPLQYLNRVLLEYTDMYRPLAMWFNPLYTYQSDPTRSYDFWDPHQGPRPMYYALYPGKGFADGTDSNPLAAKLLGIIHENPLIRILLKYYYKGELWISHLIFIGAVFYFLRAQRYPVKFADPERVSRIAVVVIMLFLTAAANAAAIASCKIAQLRFQLAGDMELHLIFLIAIFTAVCMWAPRMTAR